MKTRLRFLAFALWACILMAVLAGCVSQQGQAPDPAAGTGPDTPAASAADPAPGTGGTANGPDERPGQPAQGDTGTPGTAPPRSDNGAASPAVRADQVTAVRLAAPKSGWTGGEGWIARTDDGGKTWTSQYSGAGTVSQLFALNGQEAWAVVTDGSGKGTKRTLLSTTDGGKQWTEAGTVPSDGFLHFVSKTEAFSANAVTKDGGKTWNELHVPDQTTGDAYFHDERNGWAVAQVKDTISVLRTTDGGQSWQSVMSRKTVAPLNGALIRSAGADDAWVECIGDSGMSQTSYSLFHTADGGKSWQTVIANSTAGGGPAPGFPIDHSSGPENTGSKPGALYVVDPKTAYMGGQCPACDKPNTIGWTTDGGKTWTNGETQLEGYGNQLLAIADATHGWWIISDSAGPSVMYTTADGGKSWSKVHTFQAL
ncbi:YCF48-related protein [Paenibacillus sp. GYB004]|uniref:WD40/YVTN/BNR-like repeat-containing protein n=1 Tax=Paenibacillus sp. GYB004 TaxID=2994393 RepID=UPI002F960FEA